MITNTYYRYEFKEPAICISVELKEDSTFGWFFVGIQMIFIAPALLYVIYVFSELEKKDD